MSALALAQCVRTIERITFSSGKSYSFPPKNDFLIYTAKNSPLGAQEANKYATLIHAYLRKTLPEFKNINTITTIPFLKNVEFDFSFYYIPIMIFIITATSNAVNLTDGLDGLAIGCVGISALALAAISYISGNEIYARYLNIIYLPGNGELTVYCSAVVGASLGFLWFNSYPAQVIMGDTGALALGGAIGTLTILVKKEFLLPILGGIFFAEA